MAIVLNPSDGLRNAASYPTNPQTEAAAREQIQSVIDQVVDQTNTEFTEKSTLISNIAVVSGTDSARVTKYDNGQMEIEMKVVLGSTPITTVNGSLFDSASLNLGNWPVAFVSIPVVAMPCGTNTAGSTFFVKLVTAPTITALPYIVLERATSVTLADATIFVMAKGRWK